MVEQGHILLADDEEVFLNMTAFLLRREGYQCECAADGSTAMKLFRQTAYDLLITDIKMPGNHELELIKDFSSARPGAPVIVMTAYPEIDSAVRSLQLPVVAYLIKPFDFRDLIAETRQALTRTAIRCKSGGLSGGGFLRTVSPPVNALLAPEADTSSLSAERLENLLVELRQNLTVCHDTLKQLTETLASHKGLSSHTAEHSCSSEVDQLPEHQKEWSKESGAAEQESRLQAVRDMLSQREREILIRLCSNQRVPMIARALYISPHTVRNHLKSIFRKLDVGSQVELLTWLGQDSLNGLH